MTTTRMIAAGIAVLAVIGAGVLVYRHVAGPTVIAKVGDCLAGEDPDAFTVVACGAPTARWRVLGKVDGQHKPATSSDLATVCGTWPATLTSFWAGHSGGTGYVLCLAQR